MGKTVANQVSPSQVSGRLANWHRIMEEAGLEYDDLQTPIDDPIFRGQLVAFWKAMGKFPSVTHEAVQPSQFIPNKRQINARKIMGLNIFGIEESVRHFGIVPTEEDLAVLSSIPFSREALKVCSGSHVLIADFGLSILDVRNRTAGNAAKIFCNQDWYNGRPFAAETSVVCWRLVRKTAVPGSFGLCWDDQRSMVTGDDYIPAAREVIYVMVGHFLATGERLFESCYVRTSSMSTDSGGRPVYLGYFASVGLSVYSDWGGYSDVRVAAAACPARKVPK